jgi:serine protease
MSFRKKIFSTTAFLAAASLTAFSFVPANAEEAPAAYGSSVQAAGLMVQLAQGQSPINSDGSLIGEAETGLDLKFDSSVGLGWHALDFAQPISANEAFAFAQKIRANDRVLNADVNVILNLQEQAVSVASAVQQLKVSTSLLTDEKLKPRVKLTWKAPTNLAGGKIVGYRVEMSTDGGATFARAISNTKSTALEAYITDGLTVGQVAKFRVRAITLKGSKTSVGAASAIFSALPTTIPQVPVLSSTIVTSANPVVSWKQQTLVQRGGLAVSYTVTAKANGQASVSCSSTATTCQLSGLAAGVTYSLSIVAKNARGTSGERLPFVANDPQISKQWHLNSANGINVNAAWRRTNGDASVVVAVIDSGITNHPDLVGQTVPGYDFVSDAQSSGDGDGRDSDPADPGDGTADEPSSWHGTHVAGLIAAASNDEGGVGVASGVKVQPVRALGLMGGESKDLAAAIIWAAGIQVPGVPINATPAKVINMSLGTDSPQRCDATTQSAVESVKNMGVTMITAAGNTGTEAFWSYPGNCFGTINVGATGFNGDRAWYSNYGAGVDISAPGGDSRYSSGSPEGTFGRIYSTSNDGRTTIGNPTYSYQEGTSMAAPVLSGVVALMYSVEPTLTFDEVWAILRTTATPFASTSPCSIGVGTDAQLCGIGIVNAGAAVEAAVRLR